MQSDIVTSFLFVAGKLCFAYVTFPLFSTPLSN